MVTLSGLEYHLSGVPPEALDCPCMDGHLKELALRLTDWQEIGMFLDLDEGEMEDIECSVRQVRARNLTMLRKWRKKFGKKATYRALVDTLWKLGQANLIDQISLLLSHSSTVLCTPNYRSALQEYIPLLKECYLSPMPGSAVQFPKPLTQTYFDLSLIEKRGIERQAATQELVGLTVEGKVGEIMEKRTRVQLKDLFTLDQSRRKVILIEGAPGSGKTTLSWHICQKWESGELFSEFELVVYVQLRDPNIQTAQSIAGLLPHWTEQMVHDVFAELTAKNGEGVLFVLDGWDELPGDLPRDSPLRQLIEPVFTCPLKRSTVIVTSRPEASIEIHNLVSSRVQIVGFTQEKVEEYFTDCLKGETRAVEELLEQVKENPATEGSCYVPLNAAIIVTLFVAMGQLPSTLTKIFESLIAYCILRHYKRSTSTKGRSHFPSLDKLPPEMQTSFDSLCALAFQGILVNQITFTEEECEVYPDFSTLSLLQAVEEFLNMGLTRTYHFLHLSIQELLAARHLSKLPADTQIDILLGLVNHERFHGVFRFYAGITRLYTPGIEALTRELIHVHQEKRRIFASFDTDLLLTREEELLLECLHEAQDPMLYKLIAREWGGEKVFLRAPSPVACLSAGHLAQHLCSPQIVLCYVEDQHITLLTRGLSDNPEKPRNCLEVTLEEINCESSHSSSGLRSIVQLLSPACCVNRLVLRFHQLFGNTTAVIKLVCEAMAVNTSVRHLELVTDSNSPSDDSSEESPGPALYEMLQRNKVLESLVLAGWPIGLYIPSICEGLMHNTTLKELVLSNLSMTELGVRSLGDMLMCNQALEILDISSRQGLSDSSIVSANHEGIGHLAEALRNNRTLRILRLDDSAVCGNPEPFAAALTDNTTLEELDIYVMPFEESDVAEDVIERLMANGVLRQLLTIVIERTMSEFGGEETGRALVAVVDRWRSSEYKMTGDDDLSFPEILEMLKPLDFSVLR